MLSPNNETPDRRARSRQLIKSLVDARKETLVLFSRLVAERARADSHELYSLLQSFCQSLIDYTASAHFQLYKHIDEGKERRKPVLDIADGIYPRIVDLTRLIVDFNDKYDCEDHAENLKDLDEDLARLGAALESRMELEDRLIAVLSN